MIGFGNVKICKDILKDILKEEYGATDFSSIDSITEVRRYNAHGIGVEVCVDKDGNEVARYDWGLYVEKKNPYGDRYPSGFFRGKWVIKGVEQLENGVDAQASLPRTKDKAKDPKTQSHIPE